MTRQHLFTVAAAGLAIAIGSTAHAALTIEYLLDEGTGTSAADNAATSGLDNAALINGPTYNATSSRSASGFHLDFDGSDDYLFNNVIDDLNSVGAATVLVDFRLDARIGSTEGRLYNITDGATNSGRLETRIIETDLGGGEFGYQFRAGGRDDDDSFQSTTTGSTTLELNTWYTLGVVVDYDDDSNAGTAGSIEVFLDGASIDSGPAAIGAFNKNTGSEDSRLYVGTNNPSGAFFAGDLDLFRVYNEKLTDEQVAAASIPEPASLALLGAGGLCMLGRRRRRSA